MKCKQGELRKISQIKTKPNKSKENKSRLKRWSKNKILKLVNNMVKIPHKLNR